MKTIELTISPTGETSLQTKGFSGAACQEASRFLETALGLVLSDQKTPEFYQTQSASQQLQQGAG